MCELSLAILYFNIMKGLSYGQMFKFLHDADDANDCANVDDKVLTKARIFLQKQTS